jgi:alpha-methylacyl-CoA racemase
MPAQCDQTGWPQWKALLTERFLTRTRDDWCRILEGTDACFAPVLSMAEAHVHPHNQARDAFIDVGGQRQPAPAPRFGSTKLAMPRPPGSVSVAEALLAWDLTPEDLGLTTAG